MVFVPLEHYLKDFDERTPVAVILGKYSTSNLGAIHSLAAYHIPTVVVDARRQSSFFSRYTIGVQSPDPARFPEEYIAFLIELGRRLPDKGVLFPTGDTETLILTKQVRRPLSVLYFHVSIV